MRQNQLELDLLLMIYLVREIQQIKELSQEIEKRFLLSKPANSRFYYLGIAQESESIQIAQKLRADPFVNHPCAKFYLITLGANL